MNQKYSFKRKDGKSSLTKWQKLKEVKKEKNQTADKQEKIANSRAHKSDKLNIWEEGDIEVVVKK